jgi:radical SAM protein with 4Fe4S-binding SPASM domain
MYHVIAQNDFLLGIVGGRQYSHDCKYKSSIFNVVVEHDDKILIYNTMVKAFVITEHGNKDFFCDNSGIVLHSSINMMDLQFFIKLNIIVPISVDELQLYEELHHLIRVIEEENKSIERYNILTTTGCNARCFYCFEEGVQTISMNEQIADKVVRFIDKTRNQEKTIQIRWFGGEPLLNIHIIDYISEWLKKLNISFTSSMSSNGYLLDDPTIERAASLWNLTKVRVSFDGLEEAHNRRKNYYSLSKGNPFLRTIHNVDKLINIGISVDLRLTLDHDNKEDILALASYFVERYQEVSHLKIYTRCVFDETTSMKAEKNIDKVRELVRYKEHIDDYLRCKNMFDYKRLLPIGYQPYFCAANDPHQVVIAPNGNLCSCETIKQDTCYWGNVEEGITVSIYRDEWLVSEKPVAKCESCKFLPSCTPFRKCPNDYFDCIDRCQTAYNKYLIHEYDKFRENGMLFS